MNVPVKSPYTFYQLIGYILGISGSIFSRSSKTVYFCPKCTTLNSLNFTCHLQKKFFSSKRTDDCLKPVFFRLKMVPY